MPQGLCRLFSCCSPKAEAEPAFEGLTPSTPTTPAAPVAPAIEPTPVTDPKEVRWSVPSPATADPPEAARARESINRQIASDADADEEASDFRSPSGRSRIRKSSLSQPLTPEQREERRERKEQKRDRKQAMRVALKEIKHEAFTDLTSPVERIKLRAATAAVRVSKLGRRGPAEGSVVDTRPAAKVALQRHATMSSLDRKATLSQLLNAIGSAEGVSPGAPARRSHAQSMEELSGGSPIPYVKRWSSSEAILQLDRHARGLGPGSLAVSPPAGASSARKSADRESTTLTGAAPTGGLAMVSLRSLAAGTDEPPPVVGGASAASLGEASSLSAISFHTACSSVDGEMSSVSRQASLAELSASLAELSQVAAEAEAEAAKAKEAAVAAEAEAEAKTMAKASAEEVAKAEEAAAKAKAAEEVAAKAKAAEEAAAKAKAAEEAAAAAAAAAEEAAAATAAEEAAAATGEVEEEAVEVADAATIEAMASFVGSWRNTQTTNLEPYLKALGVGWAKRQVAMAFKPAVSFVIVEGVLQVLMPSPIGERLERFPLDEEVPDTDP